MIFVIGVLAGVALVFFVRWINDGIESRKPLEERRDELARLRGKLDQIIAGIDDELRRGF